MSMDKPLMTTREANSETVTRSFPFKFAALCILIFILGGAVTVLTLHFTVYKGPGASYAESFRILATLRQEIVDKAVLVYFSTLLFTLLGVAFIALLFSHKVAGPLYKLGIIAQQIGTGDLTLVATLRRHDALHALSHDLNTFTSTYKSVLTDVEIKTKEIRNSVQSLHDTSTPLPHDMLQKAISDISNKTDELRKILSTINQ